MTNGKTFWLVLFGSAALYFVLADVPDLAALCAFLGGLGLIRWKEFAAVRRVIKDWREEVAVSRARGDAPGWAWNLFARMGKTPE